MKHKVLRKQSNSNKCIVCGLNNEIGLEAEFFELDNGEVVAICTPKEEHQSYPGRVHGGISTALLDETIGRAIEIYNPDAWGVTVELSTRFKKPVPLGEEIKIIGRITRNTSRIFEGTGEIILKNGDVAVTAQGKYMKMSIDKIVSNENAGEEEMTLNIKDTDPTEIEY